MFLKLNKIFNISISSWRCCAEVKEGANRGLEETIVCCMTEETLNLNNRSTAELSTAIRIVNNHLNNDVDTLHFNTGRTNILSNSFDIFTNTTFFLHSE